MLRKIQRKLLKHKELYTDTTVDLDVVSRSMSNVKIGHVYDPYKKGDCPRLLNYFMILRGESLLFEYPARKFKFSPDGFSRIPSFCFPDGAKMEHRDIVHQFVFGLNDDGDLNFGICTHVYLGNSKVEFLGEISKDEVYCLCSVVSLPMISQHFKFHEFLVAHLFGVATPAPVIDDELLLPRNEPTEIPDFSSFGLKPHPEDPDFIAVEPENIPVQFRMSLETYFRMAASEDCERVYTLTDYMAVIIPKKSNAVNEVARYGFDVLFSCLSIPNVVRVLRSVLLEQKILFISENIDILTAATLCAISLAQPMAYRCAILPLLPNEEQFLDYLDSPVPYCFGVLNTERLASYRLAEDVTIVFLDADEVKYPDEIAHLPRPGKLRQELKDVLDSMQVLVPKDEDVRFWSRREGAMAPLAIKKGLKLKYSFCPDDADRLVAVFQNYVGGMVHRDKLLGCRVRDTSNLDKVKVGFVPNLYMIDIRPKDVSFFTQLISTQSLQAYFEHVCANIEAEN